VTGFDLTPYWGADDDWTGFLMLIVPAARLPITPEELARRVRDRVESDPVLYDLVKVGHAPPPDAFEEQHDWDRAFLAHLLGAAMPERRFLAPRASLNVIVVGRRRRDIDRVLLDLRGWESLKRLRVRYYHCGVVPDPRHGLTEESIREVTRAARVIITNYEERPDLAINEAEFLKIADTFIRSGMVAWNDAKTGAAPTTPTAPASPGQTPGRQPGYGAPAAPDRNVTPAQPQPASAPAAPAVPTPPAPLTLPAAPAPLTPPPSRAPLPPVFHSGEYLVLVENRSALQRLRGQRSTDADGIERLARITNGVSLAYLIVVPDEETDRRKMSRAIRTIALRVDELLATVVGDALSGRPVRVAVEVFTAVTPLNKHGVLLPAGELSKNDIPGLPVDLFDHVRTVDSLIGATQRTTRAFQARRVNVVSVHYIFVSTVPLARANTKGPDWDKLLQGGRVTWIEVGGGRAPSREEAHIYQPPAISPSPYGFHVVSDRHDIVALIKDESSAIYIYEQEATDPGFDEAPQSRGDD